MISGNAPPIPYGIGDYTANLLEALLQRTDRFAPTWLSRKERWFSSPLGNYRGIPTRKPWHKWERRGSAFTRNYLRWKKPNLVHLQEEYYSYMEGLPRAGRGEQLVALERGTHSPQQGRGHCDRLQARRTVQEKHPNFPRQQIQSTLQHHRRFQFRGFLPR